MLLIIKSNVVKDEYDVDKYMLIGKPFLNEKNNFSSDELPGIGGWVVNIDVLNILFRKFNIDKTLVNSSNNSKNWALVMKIPPYILNACGNNYDKICRMVQNESMDETDEWYEWNDNGDNLYYIF